MFFSAFSLMKSMTHGCGPGRGRNLIQSGVRGLIDLNEVATFSIYRLVPGPAGADRHV